MIACQAVVSSSTVRVTIMIYSLSAYVIRIDLLNAHTLGPFLQGFPCSHCKVDRVISPSSTPRTKKYGRGAHMVYISQLFPCCESSVSTLEPLLCLPRLREQSSPIGYPCPYMNSPHVTCASELDCSQAWYDISLGRFQD